jgi:translin
VKNLDEIAEQLRKGLVAKDEAREKLLPLCREAIRHCSNAIRAVHRQQFGAAEELINNARNLLEAAAKIGEENSEAGSTGIIRDAQKEFAEANITLAIVTGQLLARPQDLNVDTASYLNGLGEAVGELRRYLLDGMRQGDLSRGEELLEAMDDIYNVLVTMDFPDAITGGLRRTTDMVRGVLEKTRSDLTLAIRQKELEAKLGGLPHFSPLETIPEEEIPVEVVPEKVEAPTGGPQIGKKEPTLYQALEEWRNRKANEESLAPYIIVRNSWLNEIVRIQPATVKDLNAIKGFGDKRISKYGKDIITIVNRKKDNDSGKGESHE